MFSKYDQKLVSLTDDRGNSFTGKASPFTAEYGLREYGIGEDGILLGRRPFFASRISAVALLPTYEEALSDIPLGRYRHFKGKDYEVLAIARHSETGEVLVVYKALYGDGGIWCRPASMWNERVERNGKTFQRFCRLERIERVEKYERLLEEVQARPDPEKLAALEAYYTSSAWREDYEADERGEFPPDLKRGVLSQDTLYDLLEAQAGHRPEGGHSPV